MQCILYKIYFWEVFHMNYNLICIFICTPICANLSILVKSGCHMLVLPAPTQAWPCLWAQWTRSGKLHGRGELNPRPQLWWHARQDLLYLCNLRTQVIWKGQGGLLCYSPTFPLLCVSHGYLCCLLPLRCGHACGPNGHQ
jgi:hypothetical protein